MSTVFINRDVRELLSAIGRPSKQVPSLSHAIIRMLEACVADADFLEEYSAAVQLFPWALQQKDDDGFLDEVMARRILHRGLSALSPGELRRLALNLLPLRSLAKYIESHPYECYHEGPWGEIFQRFVHEDMRRQGLDPEAEMAIAKAKWLPAIQSQTASFQPGQPWQDVSDRPLGSVCE